MLSGCLAPRSSSRARSIASPMDAPFSTSRSRADSSAAGARATFSPEASRLSWRGPRSIRAVWAVTPRPGKESTRRDCPCWRRMAQARSCAQCQTSASRRISAPFWPTTCSTKLGSHTKSGYLAIWLTTLSLTDLSRHFGEGSDTHAAL